MNEQGKIILYKQLMKMELLARMKSYKVIGWEEFSNLKSKEILKYALEYRDNALSKFKKDKRSNKDDIKDGFINIGYGSDITIMELAELIKETVEHKIREVFGSSNKA